MKISEEKYSDTEEEEEYKEDQYSDTEEQPTAVFLRNPFKNRPITFKRLLQHFAVYTKQNKSSMTYLLNLLIRHQPDPMYDTLPHTGKQLLHIDGSDVPTFDIHLSLAEEIQCNISVPKTDESRPDNHVQADSEEENPMPKCYYRTTSNSTTSSRKRQRSQPKPLPQAAALDDGRKYMHFGVEAALAGESPGQVFQNANLLQYARLYNKSPDMIPSSILSYPFISPFTSFNVEQLFDREKALKQALRILKGESEEDEPSGPIPHYFLIINIDGVLAFTNSEQSEIIPILGLVHSVKSSAFSEEKAILLETTYPFVIGFFHGKSKPNLDKFLQPLLSELRRLSPNNKDPIQTKGREFTVSLRCVVADTPMRTYLKKIKSHSGYWSCERCIQKGERRLTVSKKKKSIQFLELNAPPRIDIDFLSYCLSDDSIDDHLVNVHDVSPFIDLGLPMVTGFVIDPMHTLTAGAFGRRLVGIASVKKEGKLKPSQLA
uniref:Uncharacterized protein n=1 Tax=Daphnia galeata TaxID=27404 RepID=A0A8J2RM19_9CRUS|nr:unnamed protein product [Daphnia galeata]